MPAFRSGLRNARRWKTKASISIPVPATVHAMIAPSTPVSVPNRRGSRNTPDPIIEPTTIAVSVGRLTLSLERSVVGSVDVMGFVPPGIPNGLEIGKYLGPLRGVLLVGD